MFDALEDPGQLRELRTMGCAHAQGFYFARPMPASELRRRFTGRLAAAGRETGV